MANFVGIFRIAVQNGGPVQSVLSGCALPFVDIKLEIVLRYKLSIYRVILSNVGLKDFVQFLSRICSISVQVLARFHGDLGDTH